MMQCLSAVSNVLLQALAAVHILLASFGKVHTHTHILHCRQGLALRVMSKYSETLLLAALWLLGLKGLARKRTICLPWAQVVIPDS